LLVPPAYLVGWPSGVWALAVLTAPDVKAAFGLHSAHGEPTR
jgi:hypothetical protein